VIAMAVRIDSPKSTILSRSPVATKKTTPPLMVFDHVSVAFRRRNAEEVTALSDFTLSIYPREIVALVGPSGCGKSTTLRLVAGLIEPTLGRFSIEGGSAERRRGFEEVALVFQRPTLLPWLTILQNVLYPVRVLGRKIAAKDKERAHALLEMVGLGDTAERMPGELSGGMQQRAAICRGLILDPKILLMDEPFAALDALTREELQQDLLKLHQSTHKTILFVTHSIDEAVMLADRVAVMSSRPGRLEEIVDIPLARPRDPDVQANSAFIHCAQRIRNGIFGHRGAAEGKR
jgi:NitT/TauT family transport system ATP-binding protein